MLTENKKDLFKFFQERIVQHAMGICNKSRELVPMIKLLKEVTGNNWELTPPGDNTISRGIKSMK